MPTAEELIEPLADLAVPHEDVAPLLAVARQLTDDPEAMALLGRCVRAVTRDFGDVETRADLPDLPASLGALGRCFYILVFVAALPLVRAHHRELGIPEEISRHTLADLGRHLAVHRRRTGTTGLLVPRWIRLHFHGELYQLGRLQFQRVRAGRKARALAAAEGVTLTEAARLLSVHIPDFLGPLTPAACDLSFDRAREFFARYYPREEYRAFACYSWLLDPQLRRYLPAESNVVRFQERFRSMGAVSEPDDQAPVGFVFGDTELDPLKLPRRTGMERAVGDHLRAGGHWYVGRGWFPY
ncbi:acyltransferase [Streptomyces tsukubensis]|uniref:Acyltransferase n=1 Tax=Streptomyces tsukubensis TaxID=83656 RepID=A0A1V4A4H2_9ACTN|nr:acyltransferase [Streptomyces tsukubensis]QFR97600.1 acyltransferase [Streptomyces tsukubensis]